MSTSVQVFVLDDDPVAQRAITDTLGLLGPVLASGSWSDIARPLLRGARDPGVQTLLVCDLATADMSGPEFCRIVRRYHPGAKILVFAGETPPDDLEADALLSKADGLTTLRETARELLATLAPR